MRAGGTEAVFTGALTQRPGYSTSGHLAPVHRSARTHGPNHMLAAQASAHCAPLLRLRRTRVLGAHVPRSLSDGHRKQLRIADTDSCPVAGSAWWDGWPGVDTVPHIEARIDPLLRLLGTLSTGSPPEVDQATAWRTAASARASTARRKDVSASSRPSPRYRNSSGMES